MDRPYSKKDRAEWVARNRQYLMSWVVHDLPLSRAAKKIVMKHLGVLRVEKGEDATQERGRGRPRAQIDKERVLDAMRAGGGSVRTAADALNVPRTTLGRFIERESMGGYHGYPPSLRFGDCALLAASVISPEVACARGYGRSQRGLRVPIWRHDGRIAWTQTRFDEPAHESARYGNPPEACPVVDVSPAGRELVFDRQHPLYVAESPRGADAGISVGLACVALQGVRMICTDAAQWEAVGVRDRQVYVVLDADAATNREVQAAERQLLTMLRAMGARVEALRLPKMPGNTKAGLDDYLAAGHSERDLLKLAAQ